MHSIKNQSTNFTFRFSIGVTDVIAKVFSFNFLKAVYEMDESIKLVCKETSLDVLLGELATNKLDAILSDSPLPAGSPIKAYSHLVGKSGMSFFAHQKKADELRSDFPRSLNAEAFFIAGDGSNQQLNVLSWFEQHKITPTIIGELILFPIPCNYKPNKRSTNMGKMCNVSNRVTGTPKNKSPNIIKGIKYLAEMGTGKKINANFAFGNAIPKATKIP